MKQIFIGILLAVGAWFVWRALRPGGSSESTSTTSINIGQIGGGTSSFPPLGT